MIDISKVTRWYKREIVVAGKTEIVNSPYYLPVLADTNPPDDGGEYFDLFERKKPSNITLFKQPPGLIKNQLTGQWETNPDADNLDNVGRDYYARQAIGASEEFIKVFCCGEYGKLRAGKPVYEEYNDDLHSAVNVKPVEGLSIRLAFDLGLTPACVIYQFTDKGQFRVLQEVYAEDIYIESFIDLLVIPLLKRDYSNYEIASVEFDPAGLQGDQSYGYTSDAQIIIRAFGIKAKKGITNDPTTRINSVKFFLTRMPGGQPGLLIDRDKCPNLRKGFISDYHFKKINTSTGITYTDKPNKNYASHIHDGLQYGAMSCDPYQANRGKPRPIAHTVQTGNFMGL